MGSPIVALREQLQTDTGISADNMVLVEITKEGFTRVFYDTQPVATLSDVECIYCIEVPSQTKNNNVEANATNSANSTTTTKANQDANSATHATDLLLLVANVRKQKTKTNVQGAEDKEEIVVERFGIPFSVQAARDCSYTELQKKLLREMAAILKPEVFSYATPLAEMFQIRLQDPSADPDTYLEQVAHPLLTEMIDLALSVLSSEAGPAHIKLLLEWNEPELFFSDLSDTVVEHESVARLMDAKNNSNNTAALTLEQCLEHYTKAETLSAEDAWRCPHCQQYLPVVKTLGLWSLPDILVVHFKRFRQPQEKGPQAAKLTTMVKFPLNAFDMSPHLARGEDELPNRNLTATSNSLSLRPSSWKKPRPGDSRSSTLSSRGGDNRETRYDLYAVCYHQGDTLETGHYTAACKNPYDHQWYKFDDQRVTKVCSDNIEDEIINNEAYMLFYQRRTGSDECSSSTSTSGDHWVSRIAPPPQQNSTTNSATAAAAMVKNSKTSANKSSDSIEKLPERAESQPVEIPKVPDSCRANNEAENPPTMVIKRAEDDSKLLNIDELAYADCETENIPQNANEEAEDEDELQALEQIASNETPETIFSMDEDDEHPHKTSNMNCTNTSNTKAEADNLTAESSDENKLQTSSNHIYSNGISNTNGISPPRDIKSKSASNTSSSSSAASSSPASCSSSESSPHSLLPQNINSLQHKLNGFGSHSQSNSHSAGNNYKESLLSSSLKSNSSSIIGVAALSRHNQHQWNGSRSSVSAVENAIHQQQKQQHLLQQQNQSPHSGLNLRHSFSTSSNYKLRDCTETLSSMLRNSTNTCSKDTLIFIDQQSHRTLMEDEDDDTFMGSRTLWVS